MLDLFPDLLRVSSPTGADALDYASSVTPMSWDYVDVDVLYLLAASRAIVDPDRCGVGPDRLPYRGEYPMQ